MGAKLVNSNYPLADTLLVHSSAEQFRQ